MSETDIAGVERRIDAALGRISAATSALDDRAAMRGLTEARDLALIAEEKARAEADMLAEKIARLEEALETEALAMEQLRDRNQTLKQAKDDAMTKVHELESAIEQIRSVQAADRAEMDEVIAALEPLVKE